MDVRTIYSWRGFRKDSLSNAIFGSPMFLILNRYASILGIGFFREFSEAYRSKLSFMSFLFKPYEFQFNILKPEKLYICKNEICVWMMPT